MVTWGLDSQTGSLDAEKSESDRLRERGTQNWSGRVEGSGPALPDYSTTDGGEGIPTADNLSDFSPLVKHQKETA